jgi:hypothetical protein
MQTIRSVVEVWAQNKSASRRVGVELSPSQMVAVSGGAPAGGGGSLYLKVDLTQSAQSTPVKGW